MRRAKRTLWLVLLAAVIVAAAPPLAAEALYGYGLALAGAPPPPSGAALPPLEEAALWLSAGEHAPFSVEPIRPGLEAWPFLAGRAGPFRPRPGSRMATRAARDWMPSSGPALHGWRWQLACWAVSVWATRHFTAAELTRFHAERAHLGEGIEGLAAGAARCFGRSEAALAPDELAQLVAADAAPRILDVARDPARTRAARDRVLRLLAGSGRLTAGELAAALVRAPACPAWRRLRTAEGRGKT